MKLPTRFTILALLMVIIPFQLQATGGNDKDTTLVTGAERIERLLILLHNKRVAIIANQTSLVGGVHLVDTLLSHGVKIKKVFAPEHGFRGEAGPGDMVATDTDPKTGIPVFSLYGSRKKPTKEDLADVDIIIFDIQDVGARFYTYISTLQYAMEACSEYHKRLVVLDRPNPHGSYVDGPVMEPGFQSFVGMAPIPIVHGLTVGEYARMVNGEKWNSKKKCKLRVVRMLNYNHNMEYVLPVRPSPNLPNQDAIELYPSLCLFEGTRVSVGRGTPFPFQVIGFPGLEPHDTSFCPQEIPGVIKDPPYEDVECNGRDLRSMSDSILHSGQLNLSLLLEMHSIYYPKENFFIPFFDKLAGNSLLRQQITLGWTEEEIRSTWQTDLGAYRQMRQKYLLYPE